jgi:hypothetical protein
MDHLCAVVKLLAASSVAAASKEVAASKLSQMRAIKLVNGHRGTRTATAFSPRRRRFLFRMMAQCVPTAEIIPQLSGLSDLLHPIFLLSPDRKKSQLPCLSYNMKELPSRHELSSYCFLLRRWWRPSSTTKWGLILRLSNFFIPPFSCHSGLEQHAAGAGEIME